MNGHVATLAGVCQGIRMGARNSESFFFFAFQYFKGGASSENCR